MVYYSTFWLFFFSLTIFSRLWKKKIVKNCRKYWKCKYKQNSCIHCENSDVLCAHFFTLTAIKTFPCSFWSAQCWDHHSGPRISNRCFKTALSGLPINCNCNYCWYSSWETTFQHEIPKKASKLDTLILHKKTLHALPDQTAGPSTREQISRASFASAALTSHVTSWPPVDLKEITGKGAIGGPGPKFLELLLMSLLSNCKSLWKA